MTLVTVGRSVCVCVCVCVCACVGYLDNIHRTGNTIIVLHCVDLTQHGQFFLPYSIKFHPSLLQQFHQIKPDRN